MNQELAEVCTCGGFCLLPRYIFKSSSVISVAHTDSQHGCTKCCKCSSDWRPDAVWRGSAVWGRIIAKPIQFEDVVALCTSQGRRTSKEEILVVWASTESPSRKLQGEIQHLWMWLKDFWVCVLQYASYAQFNMHSLQLWAAYLRERRLAVRGFRVDHPAVESLNNTYERALVTMHKMPRIWLDYLEMLVEQKLITKARHTFDRALTSLPITQHDRVWILYLVSSRVGLHVARFNCFGFRTWTSVHIQRWDV